LKGEKKGAGGNRGNGSTVFFWSQEARSGVSMSSVLEVLATVKFEKERIKWGGV